jgi:hypothetical protein
LISDESSPHDVHEVRSSSNEDDRTLISNESSTSQSLRTYAHKSKVDKGSLFNGSGLDAWTRASAAESENHKAVILLTEALNKHSKALENQETALKAQTKAVNTLMSLILEGGATPRSPLSSSLSSSAQG